MAPQTPPRRPASSTATNYGRDNRKAASIAAGVIIGVLILVAVAIFLWHRKTRQSSTTNHQLPGGRRGALTLHALQNHTQHRSRYRKRRRHYHHNQSSRHELKHLGPHSGGGGGDDAGCCFGHTDPPKEPGRIVVAQPIVYPRVPQPARVPPWRPQTHLHHHIHDVRHHGRGGAPAPAVAPAAPPPPPNREIVLTERVRERRRARSRSRSVRLRRGRSRTPPQREPVQMNYQQGPMIIQQQAGPGVVVEQAPVVIQPQAAPVVVEQRPVLEMMPEPEVAEVMPEQPHPPPEAPPQVYGRFVAQPPEPVPGERRVFQGPPPPGVRVPAAEQRPMVPQAPPDILPQRRPPSPPPAPPQPMPARLRGNQVPLNLRAPMPAVLPAAQVTANIRGGDVTPSSTSSSSASSTVDSSPPGPYPFPPNTDTWIPPPWTPELAYPDLSTPSSPPSLVPALWHADDPRSPSLSTLAGSSHPALPHPGNLVDFAARTGDPAPRKRAWGERRQGSLSDAVSTESSARGERRGRQVRRKGWPALVPRRAEEVMSDLMVFSREGTVKGVELAAVRDEGRVAGDQGGGKESEQRIPNVPEGERLEDIIRGITERLERQREDRAVRARAEEPAEAFPAADTASKVVVKEAVKETMKETVKETVKEAANDARHNGVQAAGNRPLWPTVESVTDEMDAGRRKQ